MAETYPIQVVCRWIGNSPAVASKHYLQTIDAHYEQALGQETPSQKAVQNPVRQLQETGCQTTQQETKNPGFTGVCEGVQFLAHHQVGGTGLEHTAKSSENQRDIGNCGAQSGAVAAQIANFPPELANAISAWASLSESDQQAILSAINMTGMPSQGSSGTLGFPSTGQGHSVSNGERGARGD